MHSRFLLPLLALALSCTTTAQPTWRFHLAFEDGTGARDTLWLLYNTTATLPVNPWPGPNVDYELGEGPIDMSDGLFHVFTRNANWDSTNTVAFPYSWFPMFETGGTIDAINWTPPMTITWDTSLFHASYLPYGQGTFGQAYLDGSYFFFHSNDATENGFNMLIDDFVSIPTGGADDLFPFAVYLGPGDPSTVEITDRSPQPTLVFPNPATDILHIQGLKGNEQIKIFDHLGRETAIVELEPLLPCTTMDISMLVAGTYFIRIIAPNTPVQLAKFHKVE